MKTDKVVSATVIDYLKNRISTQLFLFKSLIQHLLYLRKLEKRIKNNGDWQKYLKTKDDVMEQENDRDIESIEYESIYTRTEPRGDDYYN